MTGLWAFASLEFTQASSACDVWFTKRVKALSTRLRSQPGKTPGGCRETFAEDLDVQRSDFVVACRDASDDVCRNEQCKDRLGDPDGKSQLDG
jgi:hypothetical protein